MKKYINLSLFIAVVAALGSPRPALADGAAGSVNHFAVDLYSQLGSESANVFFSPYSIVQALSMTYAGARGETALEMTRAMYVTPPVEEHHQRLAGLNALLLDQAAGDEAPALRIANRLWLAEAEPVLESYLTLLHQHYGAAAAYGDFAQATEQVRREINAWVEAQTASMIPDLIPDGVLDAGTRLVLVNAIYFKGAWKFAFDRGATLLATFHASGEEQARVPLMYREGSFAYRENDLAQVIELPYRGGRYSMVVLLPRKMEELAKLEAELKSGAALGWLDAMPQTQVQVYLPRFSVTGEFLLNEPLAKMGIVQAFTEKADFSGLSSQPGLFIDSVIHKAVIEVNEEGSEAAAATAVVMQRAMARPSPRPVVFRADHPFIFLIRDRAAGCMLFLGRVNRPGAADGE